MTETAIPQPLRSLPLSRSAHAAALEPPEPRLPWRVDPLRLDAVETGNSGACLRAAVHDLGWLRRIAVRGEDRFRWLSGMVTNIVNDLAPNPAHGIWCSTRRGASWATCTSGATAKNLVWSCRRSVRKIIGAYGTFHHYGRRGVVACKWDRSGTGRSIGRCAAGSYRPARVA